MSKSEQTFYNVWFKSAKNPPPAGGESYRFEKSQIQSLVSTLFGLKDTVLKMQSGLKTYIEKNDEVLTTDTRIVAADIHRLDYIDHSNPFWPDIGMQRVTGVDLVVYWSNVYLVLTQNGALDFEVTYHENGVQLTPWMRGRLGGLGPFPNDLPDRLTG